MDVNFSQPKMEICGGIVAKKSNLQSQYLGTTGDRWQMVRLLPCRKPYHHYYYHVSCRMDVVISTSDLRTCQFCVARAMLSGATSNSTLYLYKRANPSFCCKAI